MAQKIASGRVRVTSDTLISSGKFRFTILSLSKGGTLVSNVPLKHMYLIAMSRVFYSWWLTGFEEQTSCPSVFRLQWSPFEVR